MSRRTFTKAAVLAPALGTLASSSLLATPASVHAQSLVQTQPQGNTGHRRIDVFAASGKDFSLIHRVYENGSWSDWESLGGYLTSAPAVTSWSSGRLDVFARNTKNSLSHIWFDQNRWSNWEDLGGILADAPTVTGWFGKNLNVFIRGNDGYLYHKTFIRDNGGWSGWQLMAYDPIRFTEAPAIASWDSHFSVFARDTNGALWVKDMLDPNSDRAAESLGGLLTSSPAAISSGLGRWDVFVRNASYTLSYRSFYGEALYPWVNMGGAIITSAPAVASWAPGHLDVFAIGTNGQLLWKKLELDTWTPSIGDQWIHLPTSVPMAHGLAAVSW